MWFKRSMSIAQQLIPIYNTTVHKNKEPLMWLCSCYKLKTPICHYGGAVDNPPCAYWWSPCVAAPSLASSGRPTAPLEPTERKHENVDVKHDDSRGGLVLQNNSFLTCGNFCYTSQSWMFTLFIFYVKKWNFLYIISILSVCSQISPVQHPNKYEFHRLSPG